MSLSGTQAVIVVKLLINFITIRTSSSKSIAHRDGVVIAAYFYLFIYNAAHEKHY